MRSKAPVKAKKRPRYKTREIRPMQRRRHQPKNKSGYQSLHRRPEPSWSRPDYPEIDDFQQYKSNIREQKDRELREKKARLKEDLLSKYSNGPARVTDRVPAEGVQNAAQSPR